MKYNCVRIEPNFERDAWRVSFSEDSQERVKIATYPNANSFHYPADWDKNDAKNMLIDHMVKEHNERIADLIRARDKLIELYYE